MRPVLVIEQEPSLAGLGLLGKRLETLSFPHRRLRVWEEELEGLEAADFSGIVALGGSAHAWQEDELPHLRDERLLLADAVRESVPVLGLCLGGQVLARALGAEVRPAEAPEIGWLEVVPTAEAAGDPVLGHLREPMGVYQWHEDVFELPAGTRLLATSADSRYRNQAFRLGDAWGIQFHPEVDAELSDVWLDRHPGACEAAGVDEMGLRDAIHRGEAASRPARARLFDAFCEHVALATRSGAAVR